MKNAKKSKVAVSMWQHHQSLVEKMQEVLSACLVDPKDQQKAVSQAQVATLSAFDSVFVERRQAKKCIMTLTDALRLGHVKRAVQLLDKLHGMFRPTSNDFPFEEGDVVDVIRYEHGWPDGRMSARIVARTQSARGIWSYTAQVLSDEMDHKYGDDAFIIHIEHTRDAVRS